MYVVLGLSEVGAKVTIVPSVEKLYVPVTAAPAWVTVKPFSAVIGSSAWSNSSEIGALVAIFASPPTGLVNSSFGPVVLTVKSVVK